MSGKFPGNVREIAGKCPGNFREMSRKCPGNVREMSGEFPGNFREISGKCPGNVREMSRKCPRNLREMSWKFPENPVSVCFPRFSYDFLFYVIPLFEFLFFHRFPCGTLKKCRRWPKFCVLSWNA